MTIDEKKQQELVELDKGNLELLQMLHNQIELASNTMVPLVRNYVNEVRSIRMAMANEVKDIIRSSQELQSITKHTPEIKELAITIEILKKQLTPEMVDLLKKIVS